MLEKYKQFLVWIVAFGPKLPAALAIIEEMVTDFRDGGQRLAELFGKKPVFGASSEAVTFDDAEVLELEGKAESLMGSAEEGFAAPTGKLRDLFTFMVDSGLLEILLSLLKSK